MKFWEDIVINNSKYEKSLDKTFRKDSGSYYTPLVIAEYMINDLFNSIKIKSDIPNLKFLEPCVGTGNFVVAYLKKIYDLKLSKKEVENVFNNIYVCDSNIEALNLYKENISKIANEKFNISLDKNYFDEHIGGALLYNLENNEPNTYISINNIFPNIQEKFDIVITNPPYKNLKAERSQFSSIDDYNKTKEIYSNISKQSLKSHTFATTGVLNIYKLFVEEIIEKYTKEYAYISLLVPNSILTDKSCEKLRARIYSIAKITKIITIPENNSFIDAKQALCSINMIKGQQTDNITIESNNKTYSHNVNNACNKTNAIILMEDSEIKMRDRLNTFPKIKELPFIHNLRGELDLTVYKDDILSCQISDYPLIRGRNIDYYCLKNIIEYVNPNFLSKTAKKQFVQQERIACQQISNMAKERRLTFAYIPANMILGNSCNFISIDNNLFNIDIYFMLAILNSNLINWLFKLSSSNNHVNNYELAELPIPVNCKNKIKISELTKKFLEAQSDEILKEIEKEILIAYEIQVAEEDMTNNSNKTNDLLIKNFLNDMANIIPNIDRDIATSIITKNITNDEFFIKYSSHIEKNNKKLIADIINKYQKLYNNEILNHTTFKLSDLDLEMIKTIPQGGNWKDIAKETMQKSKRLLRINETGGRTTLYGRIDYNKPSYTITTYFNRPGNGTYVHPSHERVISVREACRFQSLPDNYYITGNKTQMLKQIGNAVPSILAYQIGLKIKNIAKCNKSVDLFCGLGGLTYGLKQAGIKSVISNDIEPAFCHTLKVNNPEIYTYCGDITLEETKKHIIEYAKKNNADIICGGPPCQGFSLAGFRADNDPRNQLFRDFVDLVKAINPKVIIFENVEGLLSYQNGETYRNILELFSELNYNTEGRTLQTEEYGVPQKRKRVIIICTRKDISCLPSDLYPTKITGKEHQFITAKNAIYDLDDINCGETCFYNNDYTSDFINLMKGNISYEEYIKKLSGD